MLFSGWGKNGHQELRLQVKGLLCTGEIHWKLSSKSDEYYTNDGDDDDNEDLNDDNDDDGDDDDDNDDVDEDQGVGMIMLRILVVMMTLKSL